MPYHQIVSYPELRLASRDYLLFCCLKTPSSSKSSILSAYLTILQVRVYRTRVEETRLAMHALTILSLSSTRPKTSVTAMSSPLTATRQ